MSTVIHAKPRFREAAVIALMENMTKEAIRLRIQDLKARIKYQQADPVDWEIGDIDQLKKEYDNRIYRNRV